MQQRVLKTLEYYKILAMLKERTACCVSAELVDELEPSSKLDEVQSMLALTAEAENVIARTGTTPVDSFPDMRECLKRIHAALYVSPGELLGIAKCLRAARIVREELMKDSDSGLLYNMASFLSSFKFIEDEINRCIITEDEIFDGASAALGKIRRAMRVANERVREKLNSMIHSQTYSKYLQDPLITIRNGRFVLPVKQEYRQFVPGLIHDQSGSGATLFIEPSSVVELGNEYKKLLSEETEEIERILTGLTAMVEPRADDIRQDLQTMGEIDLVFAKARLAREMDAVQPELNSVGYIKIIEGRHPLIDPDKVVPIDIWLGSNFRSLIITGPNTGGKTVTLKIVGLFELMAQSGLFVPAEDGTELAVFDDIFADIGDEQSIEQSLSTFSSHMKNIVEILHGCDKRSLVLLDELGAGTDPIEGAALAMSILEELSSRGTDAICTTHYSEIKAFAMTHEGMENASMQFDVDKLCPTYKLYIGIPGKSNAFEISRRLGLPEAIIESAKGYLKGEDVRFEDIISSAQDQRQVAEEERAMAEQARRELERLRAEAADAKRKLDEDRAKQQAKARDEAKRIVADTKRQMEKLIAEIHQLKDIDRSAADRMIQKSRDAMREHEHALHDVDAVKKDTSGSVPKTVSPGDTVRIVTLDKQATVLQPPDSRGEVQVQAGIIKLMVKLSDLRVTKEKPKEETTSARVGLATGKHVDLSLDIRGMQVDEASILVDRYLSDAYDAGLNEVSLIHGKGTGALRAGIQAYLKKHPIVASYRMGAYGEGDAGVTVVTFKK